MLNHAYRLSILAQQAADSLSVFRHQSAAVEDRFGEAAYLWPDQRGRNVSRSILSPTLDQFAPAISGLGGQHRALLLAGAALRTAEEAIGRVFVHAEEVDQAVEKAEKARLHAEHLSATAQSRAAAAMRAASDVAGGLASLGNPPI